MRGYCINPACVSNVNSDMVAIGQAPNYALMFSIGSKRQGWADGVAGVNMLSGVLLSRESWNRDREGTWAADSTMQFLDGYQIDKDASPRVLVPVTLSTASLTTAMTGDNNDLTFTAREPGFGGNDITIEYTNAAASVLGVSVSGDDIAVSLDSNAVAPVWNSGAITTGIANTLAFGGTTITIAAAAGGGAGSLYTFSLPTVSSITMTFDTDHADYAALDAEVFASALVVAYAAMVAMGEGETLSPVKDIAFTVVGEEAAAVLTATGTKAQGDSNNAWKWVIAGVGTLAFADGNKDATVAPNTAGVDYNPATVATTAAQVMAAVIASTEAHGLVSVALAPGNSGAGAVAIMAKTGMTGGARFPATY